MGRPIAKPLWKKGPSARSNEVQVRTRARGALLLSAVGEAFAAPFDGRRLSAAEFPTINEGPFTEMEGGGPLGLAPGQVAWASEMAFCVAEMLTRGRQYDVQEAAGAYLQWEPNALHVPSTVRAAFEFLHQGIFPEEAGRRVWLAGLRRIRDNACLPRAVPMGVFFAKHRQVRAAAALQDCAVTHFDPVCQLAHATLAGLIGEAIASPQPKLERIDLERVIESELSLAAALLSEKEPEWVSQTQQGTEWLQEDFQAAKESDPCLYGPDLHLFSTEQSGVRVTFRLALWELLHAPSIEAALLDVVNRGGDAVVNAAVTGAVWGAVHGPKGIPERWEEVVMLAPGLAGGVHWEVYHPRFLVGLGCL